MMRMMGLAAFALHCGNTKDTGNGFNGFQSRLTSAATIGGG